MTDELSIKTSQPLPADTRPYTSPPQSDGFLSSNPIAPKTRPQERFSNAQIYFLRSELSIPPLLLEEPFIDLQEKKTKLPPVAGSVKLRLFINSNGLVDHALLISGSSFETLDAIVLTAFIRLKFRPGEIDGQLVNSQVIFEVDLDSLSEGFSQSSDQSQRLTTPRSR